MYEQDILNSSEKSEKDTLFNQYYQFYNNSVLPGGMRAPIGGLSPENKIEIQMSLEAKIEDFIKKVLAKYMDKIDRRDFRIDQGLSDLTEIINYTSEFDVYMLTKYGHKYVKDKDTLAMINNIGTKYDKLDTLTKKANDSYDWKKSSSYFSPQNAGIVFRRDKMKEFDIWSSEMETLWKYIQADMIKITSKLKNIRTALEELKTLKALG